MSVEKAKAHYAGKDGLKRLNCAQAVLCAFQDKFGVSEETFAKFSQCGGGNAPEGHCGAFYAAATVLKQHSPEMLAECEKQFMEQAGSTKCHQIRAGRKLPCLGCVEKAAEFMDKAPRLK